MSTEQTDTRAVVLDWILRTGAAIGLGASALLLWEYTRADNLFCAPGEGCDLVRASALGSIAGIVTPVYAVLFFLLVLALALVPGALARRGLRLVAGIGALTGIGLLLDQALVVHAFCVYCVIGDTVQVVIGLAAFANRRPALRLREREWVAFAAVLLAGFGSPFAFGLATHPRARVGAGAQAVPACVAREGGDAVTIVEFIDFECPYCRAQHFALTRLLANLGDKFGKPVRVVRKHFPLAAHKFAKDAARIAVCAEDSGRTELMTDLLFSSEDLSMAALEKNATQLGIDPTALRACVASAATTHRLQEDESCGQAAQIEALPTFFIGNERFEGLQKDDALRTAIERAATVAAVPASNGRP